MDKFDPDQYLAEVSAEAFDPDAYLREVASIRSPSGSEKLETGIRSALSSGSLGLSEPVVSAGNALAQLLIPNPSADIDARLRAQGFQIEQPEVGSFSEEYAKDVANRARLQEAAPEAALAGELVGALSPGTLSAKAFSKAAQVGTKAIPSLIAEAPALGSIVKGAASAAAGALATEIPQKEVLESAGFNAPETNIKGAAKLGAALGAIPVVGKGIGKASKTLLGAATGVNLSAAEKFLQNAEDIAKFSKTKPELVSEIKDAVNKVKTDASALQMDTSGQIQEGLGLLKSKVIEEAQKGYDILEQSGKTFKTSDIVSAIKGVNQELQKTGIVGPAASSAKAAIKNLLQEVDTFPKTMHATDVKEMLKSLDDSIDYIATPGMFAKNATQEKLAKIRRAIDQKLKGAVPEYDSQMSKVSNLSTLLDESAKQFGGQQKAFSALSTLGKPAQAIRNEKLKDFANSVGVDLERVRQAQEDAAQLASWTESTIGNKIDSLSSKKGEPIKQALKKLSELSDQDFLKQAETLNLVTQFDQQFLHGSRNVVLWSVLGSAAGGIGPGTATGAVIGSLIDKHGPRIARSVLSQVAQIRGMPSVQKIEKMSLPKGVKEELKNSLIRLVNTSQHEPASYISPENRSQLVSDIQRSDSLSNLEKAKMINEIHKTGMLKNAKAVILGAPKSPKLPVAPVETKPKSLDQSPQDSLSDFVKNRRPKEY